MSKHTPGVWVPLNYAQTITIIGYNNQVTICRIKNEVSGKPLDDEDRANAHLISAAPDLLEALQQLTVTATRYLPEYNENPLIQQAEAALAKAQGDQDGTR